MSREHLDGWAPCWSFGSYLKCHWRVISSNHNLSRHCFSKLTPLSSLWVIKSSAFFRLILPPSSHCCSVTKSCPTLCDAMDCSTLGFPVLPNHLILCCPPRLLPSIFPSIRVFSNESTLHIRGQSTGASASISVLPMNIQDWFPLELTDLISLLSKELSESSPGPQFESINSSVFYSSSLTSTHDYWKNYSFDYVVLCQQSVISAF